MLRAWLLLHVIDWNWLSNDCICSFPLIAFIKRIIWCIPVLILWRWRPIGFSLSFLFVLFFHSLLSFVSSLFISYSVCSSRSFNISKYLKVSFFSHSFIYFGYVYFEPTDGPHIEWDVILIKIHRICFFLSWEIAHLTWRFGCHWKVIYNMWCCID